MVWNVLIESVADELTSFTVLGIVADDADAAIELAFNVAVVGKREDYKARADARGYECESCGEPKVYGASELLLMVV